MMRSGRKKCEICLDYKFDFVRNPLKCHFICSRCLKTYIKLELEEHHYPLKCPYRNCKVLLSEEKTIYLVKKIKNENLLFLYKKLYKTKTLNSSFVHCPNTNCISTIYIRTKSRRCFNCKSLICGICKIGHEGLTCKEYHEKLEKKEDKEFLLLSEKMDWKQCNCGYMIERVAGCAQMTCRCKRKLCYLCGKNQCTCSSS